MAPTGWRKAALGFTLASTVTLLLNAAFIVWATANDARSLANGGIGVLITGSCAPVKELNVGIHIVINILSTVLLAGSNYCMQVLSAPDRELVDFAYEERWRLEIGIPSLGNIKHIGKRRRRLWWAIGLLSISLHLLYNSAVFSAVSASACHATSVNEASVTSVSSSDLAGLVRLNPLDCISAYRVPFQARHGDVPVMAAGNSFNDSPGRQNKIRYYAVDGYSCGCGCRCGWWSCRVCCTGWFCVYARGRRSIHDLV